MVDKAVPGSRGWGFLDEQKQGLCHALPSLVETSLKSITPVGAGECGGLLWCSGFYHLDCILILPFAMSHFPIN